ncbi:MAG: alpha/beta fold hydrolase [Gemmataceae bacterium]|nr:alpha/beta fold hydrolase [Gemmataceae bacterium]MCI0739452.1 alpha/beta fold hydrolase [Gemmataceae bacterium]
MLHRIIRSVLFATITVGLTSTTSQRGFAGDQKPVVRAEAAKVAHRFVKIDGLDIFYREAGPKDAPTLLLLHGFPTSSHMFRNLIPVLADQYHVVAPDYPGFGHSSAPSVDKFDYSFDRPLFYSYGSNPPLYPKWHAYFRKHQPPTLIVWGKNDKIFPAEGAHPYKRDLKNLEFHLLDTGHFALEEDGDRIATLMREFLRKHVAEK